MRMKLEGLVRSNGTVLRQIICIVLIGCFFDGIHLMREIVSHQTRRTIFAPALAIVWCYPTEA